MSGQTRHPGTEALASYQAGLVGGVRGKWVATHLSQCSACASVGDRLGAVATALASVPAPVLPGDVEQRIMAAIATAAAVREGALGQGAGRNAVMTDHADRVSGRVRLAPPRRVRGPRVPAVSPSLRVPLRALIPAVACLALAFTGYMLSRPPGPESRPAAVGVAASPTTPGLRGPSVRRDSLGPDLGTSFIVVASGVDYHPATLAAQVRQQLEARASSPVTSPPPGGSGGDESVPPEQLVGCVLQLTGGAVPTMVEHATYEATPAYVIAVPGHAWVVPLGCTATDPGVIASVPLSP